MAGVNAVGTLTFAANAVDAETVTVGDQVYTWESGALDAAYKVLVGASAAASAQNLYDAINATPSAIGVTVATGTLKNLQVRASAVTATTVVVQAVVPGTIGNLVASTEAMTQGSWGGAVLAGGTGSPSVDIQDIISNNQMNSAVRQALLEVANNPAGV